MALTQKDIQHIAKLARLDLSTAEEERFSIQLSSILEYVSQLEEIDTADMAYEYPVEGLRNATQEDAVIGCDDETRKRLLDAMPHKAGDFLKVKGVFSP
ncbi:Asp-tRNA(Asn)/Glu-tRNA(Gln) amidotransferase subunit GatC [Candidatus Uhrbacteria bacterium]|nr:Asp-tRNA(Asn)/Glu-tRNA(Gln) amidotransferase subunit GatC [Candidatus Uhrbacteria bacterium]